MSSDYFEALKQALPVEHYLTLFTAIHKGAVDGTDFKAPFINDWGIFNIRGHVRSSAVLSAVQDACEQGQLPLKCEIELNKAKNYNIPKFISPTGVTFYVCPVRSADGLPTNQPVRLEAYEANLDLFESFDAPNIKTALITHFHYEDSKKQVITRVSIGLPDKEGSLWVVRMSINEELEKIESKVYVAEEKVASKQPAFKDKKKSISASAQG